MFTQLVQYAKAFSVRNMDRKRLCAEISVEADW